MSHNVHFTDYPEKINKKQVQADWDNCAAHEDWQEGCSGLNLNIRWIDTVCESREDAEDYINSHDNGWYDCLAVKYRDYRKVKPNAKITELENRLTAAQKAVNDKDSRFHFADTKSAFIGCKKCSSKISREYLKRNYCPVCGADLRPESTLNSIKSAEVTAKKIAENLKVEEKKHREKCKKQAEIRWLVKIEYHT